MTLLRSDPLFPGGPALGAPPRRGYFGCCEPSPVRGIWFHQWGVGLGESEVGNKSLAPLLFFSISDASSKFGDIELGHRFFFSFYKGRNGMVKVLDLFAWPDDDKTRTET